jgi:hypothetical protein
MHMQLSNLDIRLQLFQQQIANFQLAALLFGHSSVGWTSRLCTTIVSAAAEASGSLFHMQ